MRQWNGSEMCGVMTASYNGDYAGFRVLSDGFSKISTSRYNGVPTEFRPPFPNGQFMRSQGANSANEVVWICNARTGAGVSVGTYNDTLLFFGPIDIPDGDDAGDVQNYVEWLLGLPLYTQRGVTPASTTDYLLITEQLYGYGYWGWTEGGYAPIGGKPIINLDFHMSECYSFNESGEAEIVNYVGTANNDFENAEVTGSTLPTSYTGNWTYNDAAVFNFNNTCGIKLTDDPNITGEITIETSFKRQSATGAEYLWDGRSDGGVWMLTDYISADINWNNQCTLNLSGTQTLEGYKIHVVATGKSSINTSKIYASDQFNQTSAIGTANASLCKLGNDWSVGKRYTDESFFNGEMTMHRVWDRYMGDVEAGILYRHERYRLGIGVQ